MRAVVLAFSAICLLAMPVHAGSLVDKILKFDLSAPLPVCSSRSVLGTITHRFNAAERSNWKRGFTLSTIHNPAERRVDLRDDEFGDYPLVPVRYCQGTAQMSNGQTYSMHYFIEAKGGLVGISWGAEFCVHGLDPWRVYDGRCRVAH